MAASRELIGMLLGSLVACSGPGPAPDTAAQPKPTIVISTTPAADSSGTLPSSVSETVSSLCGPPSKAYTPLAKPKRVPGCVPKQGPEHAQARLWFKQHFLLQPGARLQVKFVCDGLPVKLDQFSFARGSGHGGNLSLYTFIRSGNEFEVLAISYQGRSMMRSAHGAKNPTRFHLGRLPSVQVDQAIRGARTALNAELLEILPKSLGLGGIGSMSSNDFHLDVRLRVERDEVDFRFTGYETSNNQTIRLPLELAAEKLAPLVEGLLDNGSPALEAHREEFRRQWHAAEPHFNEPYNWWVKERYTAMAITAGSRELIPGLLLLLKPGEERSTVDTRNDALDALAAITSWDPRGQGDARLSAEEAMDAYLKECGPAAP